jgi:hypothetical protein
MIILSPATAPSLNSLASTHAIHNSFQVLGVLAFLADSIAFWNYPNLTRQEAILALFLTEVNRILAAS